MKPEDYMRRALDEEAFALYCQPIGAVEGQYTTLSAPASATVAARIHRGRQHLGTAETVSLQRITKALTATA